LKKKRESSWGQMRYAMEIRVPETGGFLEIEPSEF